jgi:predicted DsbA family dithiol-disulfide isomerase
MKIRITLICSFLILLSSTACVAQTKIMLNQDKENNPLLCNTDSGTCEIPESKTQQIDILPKQTNKSIHILYFTDPICSSCWGIEAQLRKLKLEYGDYFSIEYRMGGLLKDWSYNSGGISKPSDVSHHWDEVSQYYQMPIDGDIWLEDPLPSSYPPSNAFKAAQLQDEEKALLFLRRIREMVFLEKKNICNWDYLSSAAKEVGLDSIKLKKDADNIAKQLFENDLKVTAESGVGGFPTLIFSNQTKKLQYINGFKPYTAFENIIISLNPSAIKQKYNKDWKSLFSMFSSLTLKEFCELSEVNTNQGLEILNQLSKEGKLQVFQTKNGNIWRLKK